MRLRTGELVPKQLLQSSVTPRPFAFPENLYDPSSSIGEAPQVFEFVDPSESNRRNLALAHDPVMATTFLQPSIQRLVLAQAVVGDDHRNQPHRAGNRWFELTISNSVDSLAHLHEHTLSVAVAG